MMNLETLNDELKEFLFHSALRRLAFIIFGRGCVMRKLTILFLVVFALSGIASFVSAQEKPGKKDKQEVSVNEEMERDATRNLQAIRLYFDLRKAYLASLSRCEEVLAAYPTYSKLDEVLYYAGESSLRLSKGQGKQKSKLTPEQYADDARNYFSQLVKDHPDSKFRAKAEAELKGLGGAKSSSSKVMSKNQPQMRRTVKNEE